MTLRSGLLWFAGLVANVAATDLDEFITRQRGVALQSALNNIGPNGALAQGASAGIVVASPSKVDPDCTSTQ